VFTGIIHRIGILIKAGPRLLIRTPFKDVKKGGSIAVNGICLTVLKTQFHKRGSDICFELSEETMKKSTAGKWKKGTRLNLELPLRAGEEIGGHFVQGHVDGTGKILKILPQKNSSIYFFSYPSESCLVPKGSIAVDGISLTLASVRNGEFSVSVLPYTEKSTTLKFKRVGDTVNLETDILAKVIVKSRIKNATLYNS
jgi:riboflavin synthase